MITDQIQSVVIEILSSPGIRQGRWEEVQAEIQDEGEFILISITARDYESGEIPQEVKDEITKTLSAKLPPHPKTSEGNWMALFKDRSGSVYDSWGNYEH
jgi:hypothetical protein